MCSTTHHLILDPIIHFDQIQQIQNHSNKGEIKPFEDFNNTVVNCAPCGLKLRVNSDKHGSWKIFGA